MHHKAAPSYSFGAPQYRPRRYQYAKKLSDIGHGSHSAGRARYGKYCKKTSGSPSWTFGAR
jgi:hypothetical protein